MPSGSFTIEVIAKVEGDWQGDPIPVDPDADQVENRKIENVALIPRTHPDDDTIIIDGFQVIITDTDQDPPGLEDQIKLTDHPTADPETLWQIDGNTGTYAKLSGTVKAHIFVIKRVA